MTRPDLALARECEAALAFWQAAGVDCDFTDDATAWLAQAPPASPSEANGKAESASPVAAPAIASARQQARGRAAPSAGTSRMPRSDLLGDSPPADLAAFREWWLSAPGLDTARGFARIAPRGTAGAALMVLVPQPEERDSNRLLEGPQGQLLENILAAMGLDDSAVYLASALPCHTPMADIDALAASGMDAVIAHHVALAQPQKLLVLGTALCAMLGAQDNEGLREINHKQRKVPVLVSETLDAMMHMPRLKARFWRRWMEWTASR